MMNNAIHGTPEEVFYVIDDEAEKALDSQALYNDLQQQFPDFNHDKPEIAVKRCFIQILEDSEYMNGVLKRFEISIKEFVTLIYKEYGYIFSSYYVNKIRDILKKYDDD